MVRFVVPPGWPVPPSGWIPPRGWKPEESWGPPPPGWSFWEQEHIPQESFYAAPEDWDPSTPGKISPQQKDRGKKVTENAKALFAQAQKIQTTGEERIKRATVKTREMLQDERTKATVKKIIEDERAKTILVTGGMIGLAATKAALIERNALAVATAAAAEHKRLSEASRTIRESEDEQSSISLPPESESVDRVIPERTRDRSGSSRADSAPSVDTNASKSAPPTWTRPTWSETPASTPEDHVVQAPVRLLMNESGMFIVEKHPLLPNLYIEATKTDRITYAIAIEWGHRMQRIFYAAGEIPETWTAIRHDEFFVPMELRRDEAGHIWCRWLEPTNADREWQRDNPYVPRDSAATYRTISTALRVLGGGIRWHV